ncbi:MAG: hypothetical protein KF823_00180 [Xanthomonadales bacterium]|nr:hypothetical protein [Xanthomonadales bacterium]
MTAIRLLTALGLLLAALLTAPVARAMGSAFSYQGTLEDGGQPAHGLYDFRFRLVNSDFNGIGTVTLDAVPVSAGVFTVELDFGPSPSLYPGTFVRYLEIGIRDAGSTDPFEILAPITQLHPVPYARRAQTVVPNAINDAALADSAVNNRVLAINAVQTVNIQNGAVSAAKLAANAVQNASIQNGAVDNAKIASNTITLTRMAGARVAGVLGNLTLPGNTCHDFNVGIAGAELDDAPFVAVRSSATLPADMSLTAVRVVSVGVVQLRACNHSSFTRSWSSLPTVFFTLR